jgi:hypothetical protein
MRNPFRSLGMLIALSAVAMLGVLGSAVPAGAAGAPRPAPAASGVGRLALPPGASACRSTAAKPSTANAACRTAPAAAAHGAGTLVTPAGQSATKPARTGAAVTPALAFTVTLVASPINVAAGGTTTLTATANQDVGPTPWFVEIFDVTDNVLVCDVGSGTTCTVNVTQAGPTAIDYFAYVATFSTTSPPPNIQASAGPVWVSWGLAVSLTAVPAAMTPGGTTTLTANTNFNVGPTPWFIVIVDESTGTNVAVCGFGTTCSTTVSMAGCSVQIYEAFISADTSPPSDVRASSNSVVASWLVVSLSASPAQPAPGGTVTLTATSCLDVGPTPFFIRIYDITGGTMTLLANAGAGTSVSATVGAFAPNATHTYLAVIASTPVVAVSNPAFLTWS